MHAHNYNTACPECVAAACNLYGHAVHVHGEKTAIIQLPSHNNISLCWLLSNYTKQLIAPIGTKLNNSYDKIDVELWCQDF